MKEQRSDQGDAGRVDLSAIGVGQKSLIRLHQYAGSKLEAKEVTDIQHKTQEVLDTLDKSQKTASDPRAIYLVKQDMHLKAVARDLANDKRLRAEAGVKLYRVWKEGPLKEHTHDLDELFRRAVRFLESQESKDCIARWFQRHRPSKTVASETTLVIPGEERQAVKQNEKSPSYHDTGQTKIVDGSGRGGIKGVPDSHASPKSEVLLGTKVEQHETRDSKKPLFQPLRDTWERGVIEYILTRTPANVRVAALALLVGTILFVTVSALSIKK